jgi:hypothetical protein
VYLFSRIYKFKVFSKWRGMLIRVHGEMTADMNLPEPLTAKHISLFFLVSLGVELRRELRQQ